MTKRIASLMCLLLPTTALGAVVQLGNEISYVPEPIILKGKVNQAMLSRIENQITGKHADTDVIVIIKSPGGEVEVGEKIYSSVRNHAGKHKLKCLVVDSAASAAFNFLSRCDSRFATPGSKLLMHDVYWSLDAGIFHLADLRKLIADLAPDVAKFRAINARALRLSAAEIKYLSDLGDIEFSVSALLTNGYLEGVGHVISE